MTESKCDKNFFSGEWIRKATPIELTLEEYNRKGLLLIWYQLGLCSLEPLQEAHVRATVEHLYRKVANLSICFGTRDGERWMRRVTNPNVDFKVLEGLRLGEVRDSLRNHSYATETGPLFCVRLLRDSPDGDEAAHIQVDQDSPFSYRCHVFLGLHHTITDGTSNQLIVGFFLSLLNDVISGKQVNDEPLGTYMSGEETIKQVMLKKVLLEGDPELREKIAGEFQFQKENAPPITEGFPAFEKKQHTRALVRFLDQSTTARFIQKCRQEKVTVNSAFTAIVNIAIVDVLVMYGSNHESHMIANFHTVNLRRYWESKPLKPLGLHMSYPLMIFSETPRNVHDNFWEYTKGLGQRMKEDVLSGRILLDKAFAMLTPESTKPEATPGDSNYYACDYITSNMGDVTPLVTEGGDHVRIKTLVRGSVFYDVEYPTFLSSHTLRGIFTFIFEYSGTAIQNVVAEKICSQIMKNISELI